DRIRWRDYRYWRARLGTWGPRRRAGDDVPEQHRRHAGGLYRRGQPGHHLRQQRSGSDDRRADAVAIGRCRRQQRLPDRDGNDRHSEQPAVRAHDQRRRGLGAGRWRRARPGGQRHRRRPDRDPQFGRRDHSAGRSDHGGNPDRHRRGRCDIEPAQRRFGARQLRGDRGQFHPDRFGVAGTLTASGPVSATNITITGAPALNVTGTVSASATALLSAVATTVSSGGNVTGTTVTLTGGTGGLAFTGTGAAGQSGGIVNLNSSAGLTQASTSVITADTLQSSGVSGTVSLLGTGNTIANLGNFPTTTGFTLFDAPTGSLTQTAGTTVDGGSGAILIDVGGKAFTQSGTLTTTSNANPAVTIQNTAALSSGTISAGTGGGTVVLG